MTLILSCSSAIGKWINTHRAVTAATFLLLGLMIPATLFLLPHSGYVLELTVAGGVIKDLDKLRDVRLVPVLVACQLALLGAAITAGINLNRITTIAFAGLAAFAAAGILLRLTSWGPLFGIAALAFAFAAAWTASRDQWRQLIGHILLAAAGLSLVCNRMLGLDPAWSFAVSLAAVSTLTFWRWNVLAPWLSTLGAVIVAVALGMSAPIFWLGTSAAGFSVLDVLHALLAAGVIVDAASSAWRTWRLGQLTMPNYAAAMSVVVLAAPYVWLPSLSVDDYHFGERLLAAQALFGDSVWFVNFFSPHGLSDAGGAAAAWLTGDFTGTGIAVGGQFWLWYPAGLLAWLLIRRLGALPGFAIMFALPLGHPTVLLLALNLVLAAEAMVLRPALLAGALGMAVTFGGVFVNAGPGAGAAIVVGMIGLAINAKRGRASLGGFAMGSIVSALILIGLFWEQVTGQLHFLQVSAVNNLTIYGAGSASEILSRPVAFIFAAAPMLVVILSFGNLPKGGDATQRLVQLAMLLVPIAAFAIVMNSYASGRIDQGLGRGALISIAVLVLIPVWISLMSEPRSKGAKVAVLCAALIGVISSAEPNLRWNKPFLPPALLPPRAPVAEDMPQLGVGSADPEHVALIREVKKTVDSLLDPGETFLNMTNRTALFFYLDRHNPSPIASPYNAAPLEFQQEFLAAVSANPPPLALVRARNIEHDGLSLSLRSHQLYEFLLRTYEPFEQGGYTYAIRKDLRERLDRLPDRGLQTANKGYDFQIGAYTDGNWSKGVAIGANADRWSFALPPEIAHKLRAGDVLLFSDGIERRVVNVAGANVRTTPTIAPGAEKSLPLMMFSILNRKMEMPRDLWGRVFHVAQLNRIPSAWGRSMKYFADQIAMSSVNPELRSAHDNNLEDQTRRVYRVTGRDPQWIVAFPHPVPPPEAGLLALDIDCHSVNAKPLMQIFWRSASGNFTEEMSLRFEASFERNLVPIDSSALFGRLPDIAEIRIDLDNPDACPSLMLRDVKLLHRTPMGAD